MLAEVVKTRVFTRTYWCRRHLCVCRCELMFLYFVKLDEFQSFIAGVCLSKRSVAITILVAVKSCTVGRTGMSYSK